MSEVQSSLVRWVGGRQPGLMLRAAERVTFDVARFVGGVRGSFDGWRRRAFAVAVLPRSPDAADVFISFQRNNKATAAALAKKLRKLGYRVWWAGELVATGDFRDEIERRLNAAKAVIVIWSPDAVKSKWVRAEAAHADDDDKLVNVHTRGFGNPARRIPKPFGVTHAVEIGDIVGIVASLEVLGVTVC